MSKVTDVMWFNDLDGAIGIVLSDNGREKKAYMKKVDGFNKDADIKNILEWGAKISLQQAEALVKHLSGS